MIEKEGIKLRENPEVLELVHKEISNGFLRFTGAGDVINCGPNIDCKLCKFKQKFRICVVGGPMNEGLREYIKEYYAEMFI